MKKSVVLQHEIGSAERVVAHAAWQCSRGRNSSMSFISEHNPRRALALATTVTRNARQTSQVDSMIGGLIVKSKNYDTMTDPEIKIAARHIIASSSSEDEVQQRLRDELDYPYGIALHTTIPDDATGREARELVRGLGGLVMKNGAMAMAMLHGHNSTISI